MSAKTIQSLEILHKNRAEFAGCLHEQDRIIWEVSCCFLCFMFHKNPHLVNFLSTPALENYF